ncbi:MAG: hypothetical protein AABN33_27920 [Acidobacteriota bacterium]
MSEDTTQHLLVARVDRLILMAEETNARLPIMEERQDDLKAQLENLDAKVEKRLLDTRPIWESVQSHLENLDTRTARIETEITELRSETTSGFRGTDRKIGVLSKNLVDMTAEIRELQDQVEKLESHPV